MRRYSRQTVRKGVFRLRWPVKRRRRFVGTKEAVVVASTRRRHAQIV